MASFNATPSAPLPLRAPERAAATQPLRALERAAAAPLPLKALERAAAAPRALARLLILALALGFATDAAANTYRYTDDRGRTIHAQTVPPQFVKNGYEVLNDRGQVIQVVPRALTAEERAAQESERAQQLAAEAEERERQQADALLLRLYRSPDDIARKRDERVVLLDGQRTAVVAALEKVEAEVKTIEESIGRLTAAGNPVPEQTKETLRIRQEERDRLMTQRDRLEADKTTAITDAERDMQRLAVLLGLPEESATE